MTTKPRSSLATHGWAPLLVALLAAAPTSNAQSSESEFITWSCTGANCPWGNPLTGQALVWPDSIGAVNNRLGYSTSKGIYLPAAAANGRTIQVTSGTATAYIGAPDEASHRPLGTINAGGSLQITGMASHEVLSVQSGGSFAYELVAATPPPPEPPPSSPPPTEPPPPPPPPVEPPPPEEPVPPVENPVSAFLTWTCTGSPCPWGSSLTGRALVWPADSGATSARLGYTVSGNIYLPASRANGTVVWINSGSASLYAGLPGGSSHRFIATVNAGEFYEASGLLETEVLSVQSGNEFAYQIALGEPDTSPTTPPPSTPPPSTPPAGGDGVVMHSVPAQWHCNIPECNNPNWVAQVINWPSWSAYANNARSGQNSKTVYSDSGEVLYPYMGSWANGCEVTALSGTVLIIEWQRGTNVWRETFLTAGQTHTIQLTSPENGAMLETFDNGPAFSVSLKNCAPQPL